MAVGRRTAESKRCRAQPTSIAATYQSALPCPHRGRGPTVRRRRLRGDQVRGRSRLRSGAPSRPARALASRFGDPDAGHPARRSVIVIREALRRNGLRDALIYLQIDRGVAPRNHVYPVGLRPTLIVTVRRAQPAQSRGTGRGRRRCHLARSALEALRHQVGQLAGQYPWRGSRRQTPDAARSGCTMRTGA